MVICLNRPRSPSSLTWWGSFLTFCACTAPSRTLRACTLHSLQQQRICVAFGEPSDMYRLGAICLAVVAVLAQPSTADGKNILMMESLIGGSHYQFLSLLGKQY